MSDIICTVPIPGPQGPAGANGTNGTNGVNAFTTTTAGFVMPAEGANVTINVVTSAPFDAGQIIYIVVGGAKGYFEVVSAPTATSLTITNLENTASSLYLINSPPATSFASGASVQLGGLQGPAGTAGVSGAPVGAAYITRTIDGTLSNEQSLGLIGTGIVFNTVVGAEGTLTTVARGIANTNIAPVDDAAGLTSGEFLRATATGIESVAAATARTSLGLAIGTDVQAFDAGLTSLAALPTTGDRYAYSTGLNVWAEGTITTAGRALLDDADAAAQRVTLGVLPGYGILGSATAVDHNAVADTAIVIGSARYIIDKIMVDNASTSLTAARSGLFTAAGGGGTTLAADQVLSALTASAKFLNLTKEAILNTDVRTESTLYYRVGTAQGGAATANVRIFGWKLD